MMLFECVKTLALFWTYLSSKMTFEIGYLSWCLLWIHSLDSLDFIVLSGESCIVPFTKDPTTSYFCFFSFCYIIRVCIKSFYSNLMLLTSLLSSFIILWFCSIIFLIFSISLLVVSMNKFRVCFVLFNCNAKLILIVTTFFYPVHFCFPPFLRV